MRLKENERLKAGSLFKDLMPFGGHLDEDNRWIVLSGKMPWEEIEGIYEESHRKRTGRPCKDSRLITGLLIVKHTKRVSDRDVVKELHENPYVQYFCGYEQLVTSKEIHASTLSKARGRLGAKYFEKVEEEIIRLLVREKVIKKKELMVDATVYPANVRYPTDTGLLEDTRQWLVKGIKELVRMGGIRKTIRTYCRKARGVYVQFQRKRKKKFREIRRARKRMLQYARRNLKQIRWVLRRVKPKDLFDVIRREEIKKGLKTIEKILEQQWEMYRKNLRGIKDRIVSLHKPNVRPIVRGKDGREVEFGPKSVVAYVDGYVFLDKQEFDAFHEGVALKESLDKHKERFGEEAEIFVGDKIYGTRENREMLKVRGIRGGLVPLGRRSEMTEKEEKWVRKKQRERNRIEGGIGTSKTRYGLSRLLSRLPDGEEIVTRLGLMSMNLSTMLARV